MSYRVPIQVSESGKHRNTKLTQQDKILIGGARVIAQQLGACLTHG